MSIHLQKKKNITIHSRDQQLTSLFLSQNLTFLIRLPENYMVASAKVNPLRLSKTQLGFRVNSFEAEEKINLNSLIIDYNSVK